MKYNTNTASEGSRCQGDLQNLHQSIHSNFGCLTTLKSLHKDRNILNDGCHVGKCYELQLWCSRDCRKL